MLSKFDKYQQILTTAYWILCDAQPPRKHELRRELAAGVVRNVPLHNNSVRKAWRRGNARDAHALIASRNQEDFLATLSGALTELSRVRNRYPRYVYDRDRRGPGVPGPSRRHVRARKSS